MSSIRTISREAADYLRRRGWCQGVPLDTAGRASLLGALRNVDRKTGYGYLAAQVHWKHKHGDEWNDVVGRTAQEVIDYLDATPVTNAMLENTYGPQWRPYVQLVHAAATLPERDLSTVALRARHPRHGAEDPGISSSRFAFQALFDAHRIIPQAGADAVSAQIGSNWDAKVDRITASSAVEHAERALVARDLLLATDEGRRHYGNLTAAWADAVGRVHPDDPDWDYWQGWQGTLYGAQGVEELAAKDDLDDDDVEPRGLDDDSGYGPDSYFAHAMDRDD